MLTESTLEIAMAKKKVKSIAELSRLTGISRLTLTSYCGAGINNATIKNLLKICKVLNCTLQDLIQITYNF